LPLAFSELPKQNFFEKIKRLIRFIVDFNCVQNVPKDLLGQTGQSIGEPEFLCFGARCGELDGWFLLIVGAKLDLRGGCCRDGLIIVRLTHVVRENKRGVSPSNCRELLAGRKKKRGSHCEKSGKKNQ
jgi:hypothetical protein